MAVYDQVPVRVDGEDVFVFVKKEDDGRDTGLIPGGKYREKLRMRIGKPQKEGHQIPRFSLLQAEAQDVEQLNPRQFIAN